MQYRMKSAEFIGHDSRVGRAINDPQFHQIRKLCLIDFVRQEQSIESTIRTEVFQFRIIVTLESLGYRATVRFGVERVLLAVPGINKRTRLFRKRDDSSGGKERSRRYSGNQSDSPG